MLQLPAEIQRGVLLLLEWDDISRCAATCHAINTLVSSDLNFEYKRELFLAGVIDNPHSPHSTQTRLKMLREQETRWLHMRPASSDVLSLRTDTCDLQELDEGYFFANRDAPPSLFVYDLRHPQQLLQEEVVRNLTEAEFMHEFTVDVEQDLVACLVRGPSASSNDHTDNSLEIRLLSASTWKPHSTAIHPVLAVRRPSVFALEPLDAHLRICGDVLALAVEYDLSTPTIPARWLYVWNWKTGQSKSMMPVRHVSVSFLHEDVLLLPTNISLDIHYIRPFGEDRITSPQLMLRFMLPVRQWMFPFDKFTVWSPPNSFAPPSNPNRPSPPFYPDHSQSIFLASMYYACSVDNVSCLSLVFRRQALIERLRSVLVKFRTSEPNDSMKPEDVPWTDWGACNSRLFWEYNPASIPDARGARWVTSDPLQVFDFNQRRVRLAQTQVKGGQSVRTGYEEEYKVEPANIIQVWDEETTYGLEDSPLTSEVTTSLPCIATRYPGTHNNAGGAKVVPVHGHDVIHEAGVDDEWWNCVLMGDDTLMCMTDDFMQIDTAEKSATSIKVMRFSGDAAAHEQDCP